MDKKYYECDLNGYINPSLMAVSLQVNEQHISSIYLDLSATVTNTFLIFKIFFNVFYKA